MMFRTKCLLFVLFGFVLLSFTDWQPDFETAKRIAKDQHKLILLNFSGSDWCGPCIRMKKEIFGTEVFSAVSDANLVLLNADFPRSKKNQLEKDQRQANELLAEKYNREGKFPFTVLLTPDGNVIKSWEGLPGEDAASFSAVLKKLCDEQP